MTRSVAPPILDDRPSVARQQPSAPSLASDSARRTRPGRLLAAVLLLVTWLAACNMPNVPVGTELSVTDLSVVYDGQPHQPEITFDPPGAEIGAVVTVTPVGGQPLPTGTWPVEAGVYNVVVRASADQGGREVEGTLTIVARPIDVAPTAGQGKVFGSTDPVLTYDFVDPAGAAIVPSTATGELGRVAGESLDTYAFTLGDLDAGTNFALVLTVDAALFTIAASDLSDGSIVVANATVTYDGTGQSVDVSFDPPAGGDGALITYGDLAPGVLPVDAGEYEVTATAGHGFIGSASGTLTIAPRPIDVAPTAGQGKVFGATDPPLTYTFVDTADDAIVPTTTSGVLGREPGETLGTYAFTLGDLDAGANFALALEGDAALFTIAESALGDGGIVVTDATVTFDGDSQSVDATFDPPAAGDGALITYGDLDPGVLPVDAGEYLVTVVAGPGYIGVGTGILTIVARPVNVVPSADQGKVYGADETTYTYAFVDPSGDGVVVPTAATGALARDAGDDVGSYAFTPGDLDVGTNFVLSLTAAAFEITPRPLEPAGFTVDDKTYDGATDATGAAFLDDRLDGDELSFTFDVAFATANAGASVTATFSNIAISGGEDADNYALASNTGTTTATIAPRALSVTSVIWADKTYDGGTGATASATLVTEDVISGDDVALVAQLVGTFADANVGSHEIVASFTLIGVQAANYVVDPQPTGKADIDARPVELLDAAVDLKVYDGTLAATVTGTLQSATGSARGVLSSDAANLDFEAAFVQAGASIDPVDVIVTLTGSAADNYVINPVLALTGVVMPAKVAITPDADQGKTYGDLDPETFGFVADGLLGDDATTGALEREAGESVGSYDYGLDELSAGPNYLLYLTDDAATFAITARAITLTTATTTTVYGEDAVLTAVLAEGSTLRQGDALTGDLQRPDVTVGEHAYELGSAKVTHDQDGIIGNYAVTLATYEVTARPLMITANDADKTYGDTLDLGTTAFSVAVGDNGTGLAGNEDVTTVTLVSDGAAATATVADSPYPIVPSDAIGSDGFEATNYDITYVNGFLTVEAQTLTISGTFTTATKAYDGTTDTGEVDTTSLTLLTIANDDDVSLTAVATFDDATVGTGKTATLSSATSLTGEHAANYTLSLDGAPEGTGTVEKATIEFEITIAGTDFATEVTYDGDLTFAPNVTTSVEPVPSNEAVGFFLEITRDSNGASVSSFNPAGTYTVVVTADDPRYGGSTTQVVEVLARPITIASSTIGQTYGDIAEPMDPSLDSGTFGRNETFGDDGLLGFNAGEQVAPVSVGSYPITLGSVQILRNATVVTSNYAITFASDYEIEARTVVVTPHSDQSKTYGDADPDTFGFGTSNLVGNDDIDGALARIEGEGIGTYAFTIGTLDAGDNYALELALEAPTFAITSRAVTLTTAEPTYVYGDTVLDLTAVLVEGSTLRDGDALSGSLALSATNAGEHTFELGDAILTRDDTDVTDVTDNYDITFAEYTIEPRPAAITPTSDQSKTYGDPDPLFGYTVDLVDLDTIDGVLGREEGEDVATYVYTLGTLTDSNYIFSLADDSPTFEITARAITLHATVASKHYSVDDPDLSPVVADGTLRNGDDLVGVLTHAGTDVGTYPLTIGMVTIVRETENVSANYTVTFGTFTIDPLPVTFDITNADFILGEGSERTHAFFGNGVTPIRGLDVSIAPEGADPTYRFTYRHTHDANHTPFANPATVQSIVALGTYQVTITDTSTNHVGVTVLTVWVTDAVGVAFGQPTYEELVGSATSTQVTLVNANGSPRAAGPVALTVDLASDTSSVSFWDGDGTSTAITVNIAPGTTSADIQVHANTLAAAAANLSATVTGTPLPVLDAGSATFLITATLAFTTAATSVGADASSATIEIALLGAGGIAFSHTIDIDMVVALSSTPTGVVFRNDADTADITSVTIPAGDNLASFRARSANAGTYELHASHTGTFAGVAAGSQDLTITPKPIVTSVSPNSVEKGQTIALMVNGSGFTADTTISFSGDDVHVNVNSVLLVNPTQLAVSVDIDDSTDVGTRDVTVTNPDGGTSTLTGAITLTITEPTVITFVPGQALGTSTTTVSANEALVLTGEAPGVFDGNQVLLRYRVKGAPSWISINVSEIKESDGMWSLAWEAPSVTGTFEMWAVYEDGYSSYQDLVVQ